MERKRKMDSVDDLRITKHLKILLGGKVISLTLCDGNSEYLELLNDASEAIKLAVEKIECLENFFVESSKKTCLPGSKSEPEKDTSSSGLNKENNCSENDSALYYYDWVGSSTSSKGCSSENPTNTLIEGIPSNTNDQPTVELRLIDEDTLLNASVEFANQFQTYVDNLRNEITEQELTTILEKAGLKNFAITLKHRPSHSFAFVKFIDEDNFNKALSFDKKLLDNGRKITIRVCCPQREKVKNNYKNEKSWRLRSVDNRDNRNFSSDHLGDQPREFWNHLEEPMRSGPGNWNEREVSPQHQNYGETTPEGASFNNGKIWTSASKHVWKPSRGKSLRGKNNAQRWSPGSKYVTQQNSPNLYPKGNHEIQN